MNLFYYISKTWYWSQFYYVLLFRSMMKQLPCSNAKSRKRENDTARCHKGITLGLIHMSRSKLIDINMLFENTELFTSVTTNYVVCCVLFELVKCNSFYCNAYIIIAIAQNISIVACLPLNISLVVRYIADYLSDPPLLLAVSLICPDPATNNPLPGCLPLHWKCRFPPQVMSNQMWSLDGNNENHHAHSLLCCTLKDTAHCWTLFFLSSYMI